MSSSLDAHLERSGRGWIVRVPLRRELVEIDKRTVIGERVVIRRVPRKDVRQVGASVRRERLRVDEERFRRAPRDEQRLERAPVDERLARETRRRESSGQA